MHRRVTVVVMSVCVCVSVKSHLTSGASVRRENAAKAVNEGQNTCGVFSETPLLPRSSDPSLGGHQRVTRILWIFICQCTMQYTSSTSNLANVNYAYSLHS